MLKCFYSFGSWLATKGHTAALPPLPTLGWGGEWKEKVKNSWVGIRAV